MSVNNSVTIFGLKLPLRRVHLTCGMDVATKDLPLTRPLSRLNQLGVGSGDSRENNSHKWVVDLITDVSVPPGLRIYVCVKYV